MPRMKLLGEPGWGSAIVDAQLAWYGFDYDFEAVGDLFASAEAREKVGALNPLAQIPTLVLPSGEVMTESAAITLYLADLAGDGTLVPAPGDPARAKFLRRDRAVRARRAAARGDVAPELPLSPKRASTIGGGGRRARSAAPIFRRRGT